MDKHIVTKKELFDAINEEAKKLDFDAVKKYGALLIHEPDFANDVFPDIMEDNALAFTVLFTTDTAKDKALMVKLTENVAKHFGVTMDSRHSDLRCEQMTDDEKSAINATCNIKMSAMVHYCDWEWFFDPNN